MSPNLVVWHETQVAMDLENGVHSFGAAPFDLPDLHPETRKSLVIFLLSECMADVGAANRVSVAHLSQTCNETAELS